MQKKWRLKGARDKISKRNHAINKQEKNMKKNIKVVAFVVINLLYVGVLLWSLMVYTSLFKGVPWYEPCGTQFLGILFLSAPAFLILGISLFVLGKFIHIPFISKCLPLIAMAGLSLPITIDGSLSRITLLIGTVIGMAILMLTIVSIGKNLRKLGKQLP
jgi:hypothetical protein